MEFVTMPSLVARRPRSVRRIAIAATFVAMPLFVLLACEPEPPTGTGGGPDCSTQPFTCADGETCWPNDNVSKWICLEAKKGQGQGAACNLIGGQVSCDEDLVCIVQGKGDGKGVCTPYCEPMSADHECGAAACVEFTINTASGTKFLVHACDPDGGGSTSSASSASAGSSSSGG